MEEEVLKVNINISDEGVVYIDGLTADMAALDETIENNSILMNCSSENGYYVMFQNYRAFLCKSGATVAEIHKKLDFVNYLYENQCQLKKEALGSALKVIEAASRILGVSMAETYHNIVERLNYLEQNK